ncbi:DUF4387 domain-containing protein [Paraburkholderia sp. XV]|uniref:DUF4387 domain-containing protein n=1 Tax=Paraburkholderia sp. XV TaxID=2831520 RepID=UPI001CD7FFCD|nr:DUF4387 domain-containing protein [Paraburkholderia sp. XV]
MQLSDIAAMVRSKNAGPFVLTFDILFGDDDSYQRVKRSGALNVGMFSRLYRTTPDKVRFFECDSARAFKFSIPHPTTQGALGASDLHGGQQFIPLLSVCID